MNLSESFKFCNASFTKTIFPSVNSKSRLSKTSEKQIVSSSPESSVNLENKTFPSFEVLSLFSELKTTLLLMFKICLMYFQKLT